MVAGLDLNWLHSHLQQLRIGPVEASSAGVVYIADRDNIVLARSPTVPDSIGRKLPAELQAAVEADRSGIQRITDPAGDTRLIASVP